MKVRVIVAAACAPAPSRSLSDRCPGIDSTSRFTAAVPDYICAYILERPRDSDIEMLKRIYARFNARDIDGVLAVLADDIAWANGMDGGHVHGREAVRAYWTRQWTVVSLHVEPEGRRTAGLSRESGRPSTTWTAR